MRPFVPLLLLVLFVAVARSQQHKRLRAHQALVEGLAIGSEVMTSSGLFGVVRSVDADAVHLEIARDVVVRVAPGAISRRITQPSATSEGIPTSQTAPASTESTDSAPTHTRSVPEAES